MKRIRNISLLALSLHFIQVLWAEGENPATEEKLVLSIVKGEARAQYDKNLKDHITFLKRKRARYKSDVDFLSIVFYKTHRVFLKSYKREVSMGDTFANGEYDCVTGTLLLSLVLEELNYNFKIHETAYHIYLSIEKDGKRFIMESTSPLYGFISDPREVRKIEQEFASVTVDTTAYRFKSNTSNTIGIVELVGLQYFNLAVKSYNKGDFSAAMDLVKRGYTYYPSNRMKEFEMVILDATTLSNSNTSFAEGLD